MTTMLAIRRTPGERRSASARFVSGPMATTVAPASMLSINRRAAAPVLGGLAPAGIVGRYLRVLQAARMRAAIEERVRACLHWRLCAPSQRKRGAGTGCAHSVALDARGDGHQLH